MAERLEIWTVYLTPRGETHRFENREQAIDYIVERLQRGQAARLIDPQDRAWGIVALAPGVKAQVVQEV